MDQQVVVGFEDSGRSAGALSYAAREARVRQASLLVVDAGRRPSGAGDAVARLTAGDPGLVVTSVPADGDPVSALVAASRGAELLVVGGCDAGASEPAVFAVLEQSECPVVVVRGDSAPAIKRIMVGIDIDAPGSSSEVLGFAVAEGLLHHAEVYAIHVWDDPEHLYRTDAYELHIGHAALHDSRRERLAAIIEPWEEKHPDLIITREVFPGSPGHLLVAATRLTDTLVIGGRVHRSSAEIQPTGMRVGTLAETVLRHARCPVTMVPVG